MRRRTPQTQVAFVEYLDVRPAPLIGHPTVVVRIGFLLTQMIGCLQADYVEWHVTLTNDS
jgi:hypothetical protein